MSGNMMTVTILCCLAGACTGEEAAPPAEQPGADIPEATGGDSVVTPQDSAGLDASGETGSGMDADLAEGCGLLGVTCPEGYACTSGHQEGWDYCHSEADDSVFVPAGPAFIGCDPTVSNCTDFNQPMHEVQVPAFAIQRLEVSGAAVDGSCGAPTVAAHCMSWLEARDYCEGTLGGGWRLCSEAEWEKAARGGCETVGVTGGGAECAAATATRVYAWGDEEPTCALATLRESGVGGCGADSPGPPDSNPAGASVYGALNLNGNVAEFVADCWHDSYEGAPTDGSAWTEDCPNPDIIVHKGGMYNQDSSWLPSSFRYQTYHSVSVIIGYGFRCCKSLP